MFYFSFIGQRYFVSKHLMRKYVLFICSTERYFTINHYTKHSSRVRLWRAPKAHACMTSFKRFMLIFNTVYCNVWYNLDQWFSNLFEAVYHRRWLSTNTPGNCRKPSKKSSSNDKLGMAFLFFTSWTPILGITVFIANLLFFGYI